MNLKREWIELWFGKYQGKTLPQIMFSDPDWFFWAYDNKIFQGKENLRVEANEIYKKSISIKIPQKGPIKLVAEYGIHPITNNFCDLEIVPEDRRPHVGSTSVFRKSVIDMSAPRKIQSYDKLGCKIMITAVKCYVLGNAKLKMTKERCEDFFNNNANFDL